MNMGWTPTLSTALAYVLGVEVVTQLAAEMDEKGKKNWQLAQRLTWRLT